MLQYHATALIAFLLLAFYLHEASGYLRPLPGALTRVTKFSTLTTESLRKADKVTPYMSDSASISVNEKPNNGGNKLWNAYVKTTDVLTTLFPVWTVLFAGLALKRPESFAWFTTKYFTASLGKSVILVRIFIMILSC